MLYRQENENRKEMHCAQMKMRHIASGSYGYYLLENAQDMPVVVRRELGVLKNSEKMMQYIMKKQASGICIYYKENWESIGEEKVAKQN